MFSVCLSNTQYVILLSVIIAAGLSPGTAAERREPGQQIPPQLCSRMVCLDSCTFIRIYGSQSEQQLPGVWPVLVLLMVAGGLSVLFS